MIVVILLLKYEIKMLNCKHLREKVNFLNSRN